MAEKQDAEKLQGWQGVLCCGYGGEGMVSSCVIGYLGGRRQVLYELSISFAHLLSAWCRGRLWALWERSRSSSHRRFRNTHWDLTWSLFSIEVHHNSTWIATSHLRLQLPSHTAFQLREQPTARRHKLFTITHTPSVRIRENYWKQSRTFGHKALRGGMQKPHSPDCLLLSKTFSCAAKLQLGPFSMDRHCSLVKNDMQCYQLLSCSISTQNAFLAHYWPQSLEKNGENYIFRCHLFCYL